MTPTERTTFLSAWTEYDGPSFFFLNQTPVAGGVGVYRQSWSGSVWYPVSICKLDRPWTGGPSTPRTSKRPSLTTRIDRGDTQEWSFLSCSLRILIVVDG